MELPVAQLNYLPADDSVVPPRLGYRLLPSLTPFERPWHRWMGVVLAVAITVAYFALLMCYWAPAHKGVDQNGYLVGGRMYAQTFSTGYKPASDYGFVGNMWVRADSGVNYPKYPLGLPMLYAASLWIFGSQPGDLGVRLAFLVSPLGTALAVLGVYAIARRFASVYASICAMILFAFCQTGLMLANNPNSHGSCVGVVTWGFYFLICYWQSGSIWRGLLGGFLLGFAVTIRYTEGALALGIALIAFSMVRTIWPTILLLATSAGWLIFAAIPWTTDDVKRATALHFAAIAPGLGVLAFVVWNSIRDWRATLVAAMPTLGWVVPVAYLVGFNYITQGTITGYDTTNESAMGAAFTSDHIAQNWEKAIRQINDGGAFFFFPLGLMGLLVLLKRSARLASLLLIWLIPGVLVYMAYYWAPDRGISYLRFFLTMFPALAVGCAALIAQMHRRSWATALSVGLIVAMAASFSGYRAVYGMEEGGFTDQGMETQHRQQANLAALGQVVARAIPEGSIVLAMQEDLHYLQFLGNYECFRADAFRSGVMSELSRRLDSKDPNDPDPIQRARAEFIKKTYEGKSDRDLITVENQLMDNAFTRGQRVFLVVERDLVNEFARKFLRDRSKYTWKIVDTYNDMPPIMDSDSTPDKKTQNTNPMRNFGPRPRRNANFEKLVRFQIVEVTPVKPAEPTTRPTTGPATRPMTTPPPTTQPAK